MDAAAAECSAVDEKWAYLREDFYRIAGYARGGFTVNPDNMLTRIQGYTSCYNICCGGGNTVMRLYCRVQTMIEEYQREAARTLFETGSESRTRTGVELLFILGDHWRNHRVLTKWCEKFFSHLDKLICCWPFNDSVRNMLLKCFASAQYGRVKPSFIEAMLAEIDKDRNGAVANCGAVKVGTEMLVELGLGERGKEETKLYREDFQDAFLEATRAYYRRACAEVLQQEGGRWRFLEWAEQRLAQEARRAAQCLHPSTAEPLQKVLDEVILKPHFPELLMDEDCGFEALLVASKAEDQRRMLTLCKRINGVTKMADVLCELISKQGASLNAAFCKGEDDLVTYVEAVMELHGRFKGIVSTRFEQCPAFVEALKMGFEAFVNVTYSRELKGDKKVRSSFAEVLPTFCDTILKNEKIKADQFAAKLDSIMGIYSFISDKQLFEEVYRRQLSKRLLITKTDSDHEKEILARLKVTMGSAYVSKMTGMINDLQQSMELQASFLEDCRTKEIVLGLDLSVQVLRQGCWPSYKVEAMNLPAVLSAAYERFRQFYSRKHPERLLKLVHSLGTLTVIVGFDSGQEKELTMSTVQGLVVEQLSHGSPMSIADLAKTLDVPPETVMRLVAPLCINQPGLRQGVRTDILYREAQTKGKLTPADVLSMNPSFACPARKLKMPRPVDEGATQAAQDAAGDQKKFLLEAAIVRVMKARKSLDLNSLQAEVARQVSSRFVPDFKMVKKLVEDLIQREYLVRDESSVNVFNYLA